MANVSNVTTLGGRTLRVRFRESGHLGGSLAQLYQLIMRLDQCQLDTGFVWFSKSSVAAKLFQLPGASRKRRISMPPSPAPDHRLRLRRAVRHRLDQPLPIRERAITPVWSLIRRIGHK